MPSKSGESGGVQEMLSLLVSDLDNMVTEADANEAAAQGRYEEIVNRFSEKKKHDQDTLTAKNSQKADAMVALSEAQETKADKDAEIAATQKTIASLHAECDWLAANFDARKSARADESASLSNAKAILSGADY